MLDKLVNEVTGVFGLNPPTRRRKRTTKPRTRVVRVYSPPARRTKRKAKRTTRRYR
jgi:hypothetical protein